MMGKLAAKGFSLATPVLSKIALSWFQTILQNSTFNISNDPPNQILNLNTAKSMFKDFSLNFIDNKIGVSLTNMTNFSSILNVHDSGKMFLENDRINSNFRQFIDKLYKMLFFLLLKKGDLTHIDTSKPVKIVLNKAASFIIAKFFYLKNHPVISGANYEIKSLPYKKNKGGNIML